MNWCCHAIIIFSEKLIDKVNPFLIIIIALKKPYFEVFWFKFVTLCVKDQKTTKYSFGFMKFSCSNRFEPLLLHQQGEFLFNKTRSEHPVHSNLTHKNNMKVSVSNWKIYDLNCLIISILYMLTYLIARFTVQYDQLSTYLINLR